MKATDKQEIIKGQLFNTVFYDVDYYEPSGESDFLDFLELILPVNTTIYCSFGRTDIFLMEQATDENKKKILSLIKSNGELILIYEKTSEIYAYCGKFTLNREDTKKLILDMFKFFYICSLEFSLKENDWDKYKEYAKILFKEGDQNGIKAYKLFKQKFTLSKGLGPDNFHLNYSTNFSPSI